jgi:hypothetical protein
MSSKPPLIDKLSSMIERWKRANLFWCNLLGIHDYDGMLPDYTEFGVKKRISEIEDDLEQLEIIAEPHKQNKFSKFEYLLVKLALERELFELKDLADFKENPLVFIRPLTWVERTYTARSFAPVEDRISLIIDFERKFPSFLDQARTVLNEKLPHPKVFLSIKYISGVLEYFSSQLQPFIEQTEDKSKLRTWQAVNEKAINALKDFHRQLQEVYLPRTRTEFALGEAKFAEYLKRTEFVDISIDKLLEIGEQDLQRNFDQLQAILKDKGGTKYLEELLQDFPPPEEILDAVQHSLTRTRQFVIDSNIASIPTEEQCKVLFTPKSSRATSFASVNPPGPFEVPEASEAYYYVTPPDPAWDERQKHEFMALFSRPIIEMTTIHEAWPGHYLQFLTMRRSESEIIKLFGLSYSMLEGWAHYCEEMVIEQGYEPFDRSDLEIGQLLEALMRNCRYVAAIKMHCKGMSIEDAKKLFQDKAFMDERHAEMQAHRGTIDPMYLNYTLGKLLLKKLREDYANQRGDVFSLRKFHDELLGYGVPPIIALREILLENPDLIPKVL